MKSLLALCLAWLAANADVGNEIEVGYEDALMMNDTDADQRRLFGFIVPIIAKPLVVWGVKTVTKVAVVKAAKYAGLSAGKTAIAKGVAKAGAKIGTKALFNHLTPSGKQAADNRLTAADNRYFEHLTAGGPAAAKSGKTQNYPYIADIGSSAHNTKTVSADLELVCPYHVDKDDWYGSDTYSSTFRVTTSGNRITVTRTDMNLGWGQNLQIICFPAKGCDEVWEAYSGAWNRPGCTPGTHWPITHTTMPCDPPFCIKKRDMCVRAGEAAHVRLMRKCAAKDVSPAYTYVGCYVDDASRDLNFGPKKWGYDAKMCSNACKGYSHFALQAHGWCVCGDGYATKPQYVKKPDAECGTHGNGATWRNSVYRQNGCEPEVGKNWMGLPGFQPVVALHNKVYSAGDCSNLCDANNKCEFYVYVGSMLQCFLKKIFTHKLAGSIDMVSGWRCNGKPISHVHFRRRSSDVAVPQIELPEPEEKDIDEAAQSLLRRLNPHQF